MPDAINDMIGKQTASIDEFKLNISDQLANLDKTDQFRAINQKLNKIGRAYNEENEKVDKVDVEVQETSKRVDVIEEKVGCLRIEAEEHVAKLAAE